jgi:enoyl-CoA hydratase/carnithine racemase
MMPTLDLKKKGSVYVLTMTNGEQSNTFTDEVLQEYHGILDELEGSADNGAVVVTSNHHKFWSTGINLEWLLGKPPTYFPEFAALLDKFLLRWALLDLPTVGCLTGHTFAGGALLASTMDFRLMREDKGWFCFPEVDIKIPFSDLMSDLIKMLTTPQALRELALTGKRVAGKDAVAMDIADAAYPEDELLDKAMELAEMLATKDRKTYTAIKRGLRKQLLAYVDQ